MEIVRLWDLLKTNDALPNNSVKELGIYCWKKLAEEINAPPSTDCLS